jgi:SM-20-related protein
LWLEEPNTGVAGEFLAWLTELRTELNRELFLSLVEAELHFALYPAGGFYRKHIDNFRGSSARLVTVILYLNPDWQPEQGGQLQMYLDNKTLEVAPEAGTLVLFLSERFEHEVLPTEQERLSLTGWLRRRS